MASLLPDASRYFPYCGAESHDSMCTRSIFDGAALSACVLLVSCWCYAYKRTEGGTRTEAKRLGKMDILYDSKVKLFVVTLGVSK